MPAAVGCCYCAKFTHAAVTAENVGIRALLGRNHEINKSMILLTLQITALVTFATVMFWLRLM